MNDVPEVAMECAGRLQKEARWVEAEECVEVPDCDPNFFYL